MFRRTLVFSPALAVPPLPRTFLFTRSKVLHSVIGINPFRASHGRMSTTVHAVSPTPSPSSMATDSISAADADNTNIGHAGFLAKAASSAKWKGEKKGKAEKAACSHNVAGHCSDDEIEWDGDDLADVMKGKGKLSPTSSHLFKLVLPLAYLSLVKPASTADVHQTNIKGDNSTDPPTMFLLHPSQPLSHVSRLIASSLITSTTPGATTTACPSTASGNSPDSSFQEPTFPKSVTVSFRNRTPTGQTVQWSDSTDVGDFIRDAARVVRFEICIRCEYASRPTRGQQDEDKDRAEDHIICVQVPTFASRTIYLRRRLHILQTRLRELESIKRECDAEAHRGARRVAMGGFGMLLTYWAAVARLTFWDYGWDVMEPITYLSGLSTVICGYLWFLYQGREVSYSSVLYRSVSSRRQVLYREKGFDADKWQDIHTEVGNLKKEIERIAEDYE